jgi:hypothetical protein
MDDVTRAVRVLGQLRDLGVELSIDDVGTGYSSLASLTQLPLDELKIDRAFIDGVQHQGRDREVVKAVIAMARARPAGDGRGRRDHHAASGRSAAVWRRASSSRSRPHGVVLRGNPAA